jgi:hypothetical protein
MVLVASGVASCNCSIKQLHARRRQHHTGEHQQVRVAKGIERHARTITAANAAERVLGLLIVPIEVAPPERSGERQRQQRRRHKLDRDWLARRANADRDDRLAKRR